MAVTNISKGLLIKTCTLLVFTLSLCGSTLEVIQRSGVEEFQNDIVPLGFLPGHNSRRHSRSIASTQYGTDYISATFGRNGYLNLSGLHSIMSRLKLGRYSVLNTRFKQSNECLTGEQILFKLGFNNTAQVSGSKIDKVSSILVEQLVKEACVHVPIPITVTKGKVEPGKAWGFAILFVTIISLASMLGAFVVPFMNREFYQKLLLFMVSLAVGVLCGSGVFHLLPSTFGFGKDGDFTYLWKSCVVVGGIYFFFITENLMKIYIRFSDWKAESLKRKRRKENGSTGKTDSHASQFLDVVNPDNMHDIHALDSVHVTDTNCFHEHGMDSLHMAGNHQIDKENTMEYFVQPSEQQICKKKRIAPVAWMIILGDGLHNFIDGLAIGAAFTSSVIEGVSTSLAILCEEMPHELGDFAILLNSGMSYRQAILCNFLSACTCYVGMVIGVMLGNATSAVKWIYALAAGMFMYISLVDMLPEATGMQVSVSGRSKKETMKNFVLVNFGILFGFSVMFLLALYGGEIKI